MNWGGDALAHGEHLASLHKFITQHCEIFPWDPDGEQPLACDEVHRQYVALFERSLVAAVRDVGDIVEDERFAEAMARALEHNSEEAEHIMMHVAAAEDY